MVFVICLSTVFFFELYLSDLGPLDVFVDSCGRFEVQTAYSGFLNRRIRNPLTRFFLNPRPSFSLFLSSATSFFSPNRTASLSPPRGHAGAVVWSMLLPPAAVGLPPSWSRGRWPAGEPSAPLSPVATARGPPRAGHASSRPRFPLCSGRQAPRLFPSRVLNL
jgi:hypothetical protein